MNTIDINNLSVVHIDQLIGQVRNVLSEEEKESFSKEIETTEIEYKQEIENIQIETFQL